MAYYRMTTKERTAITMSTSSVSALKRREKKKRRAIQMDSIRKRTELLAIAMSRKNNK